LAYDYSYQSLIFENIMNIQDNFCIDENQLVQEIMAKKEKN
jgi:hypothetical protein